MRTFKYFLIRFMTREKEGRRKIIIVEQSLRQKKRHGPGASQLKLEIAPGVTSEVTKKRHVV